ncbi:MAG: ribonuclease III [Pseudomonadota bacterium]
MESARRKLFARLAVTPADPGLFELAFRHRSAGGGNNERLEFIGDAVLGCVIAEALYSRFATNEEGVLSRLRSRLVRDQTLAEIARDYELGEVIELGPGERKSGGIRRDSILADAFEALLGAVFVDQGFDVAKRVIIQIYAQRLAALTLDDANKDAKTLLQEWLQARGLELPQYTLVETVGPPHARQFTMACEVVELGHQEVATATSRRMAEQQAARQMLGRVQQ